MFVCTKVNHDLTVTSSRSEWHPFYKFFNAMHTIRTGSWFFYWFFSSDRFAACFSQRLWTLLNSFNMLNTPPINDKHGRWFFAIIWRKKENHRVLKLSFLFLKQIAFKCAETSFWSDIYCLLPTYGSYAYFRSFSLSFLHSLTNLVYVEWHHPPKKRKSFIITRRRTES